MKKIIFLIFFIIGGMMFTNIYAQYPIPSFKTPVNGKANFQERSLSMLDNDSLIYGKRQIIITVTCVGKAIGECSATVWVYSLDGRDILGPYTVYGGGSLYVNIDDREWGVYVQTDDQITVSVWIESTPLDLKTGMKTPTPQLQNKDLLERKRISLEYLLFACKY
jgi:hypothetical protein